MDKDRKIKTLILTSKSSWFVPYAYELADRLKSKSVQCDVYHDHRNIKKPYDIVFFLSYFRIVDRKFLENNSYNVVVHESDLPKGRGWAPFFWQVIEGRNHIPVVLFEAVEEMDAGDVYLKQYIELEGHELHDELREKQAHVTKELVETFMDKYFADSIEKAPQEGEPTYYSKRTPQESKLDAHKTIAEQFDLLRTVNNSDFPAYFDYRGHRYIIKIEKYE